MTKERAIEDSRANVPKQSLTESPDRHRTEGTQPGMPVMLHLQHRLGNQALQRLLAQRSGGDGSFELDDDTANRINRARGGGQSLDSAMQKQAGAAMGHDFGRVRVHTSREADGLSRQLAARAFTTGRDVFFREGAYDPHTSNGQELIAHELTHVVQQGTGAAGGGGGRMTVNAPGDAFEREADATARAVTGPGAAAGVQRQTLPQEEEEAPQDLQRKEVDEEEEPQDLQRQEVDEEEEPQDL